MVRSNSKNGFTIVELLVVVVVIAILAAVAIVSYVTIAERARQAAIESEIAIAKSKLEQYKGTNATNTYPSTASEVKLMMSSLDTFSYKPINSGADYCLYVKKGNYSGFIYGSSPDRKDGYCYSQCDAPLTCSINTVTSAMTKDSQGNYYLLNYGSNIYNPATLITSRDVDIAKYDSNKDIVWIKGGSGTSDGLLNTTFYPWGIFTDPQDNIWVVDTGNHRLQKFDSNGNFLFKLGGTAAGSASDQFNTPYGMAFTNDGHLWATDRLNNRFKKYTLSGTLVTTIGNVNGATLNQPHGIALDDAQNIYIASRHNHRIQKYTSAGVLTASIGLGTAGNANGQLNEPTTVLIDSSNGDIYTYELVNRRISVFAANGTFLRNFSIVSLSPEMDTHRSFSMIWDGDNISLAVQNANTVRLQTVTKTGSLVEVVRSADL